MIDVFGVLNIELVDKLLVEKIFLNENFNYELVKRVLIYLVIKFRFFYEVI